MNQRKLAMIIISVVITGLLILTVYDYKSQLRLEDEVRSKVLDRQRILQEIEQSTPLVTLRGVVSYNDTCSCVVIDGTRISFSGSADQSFIMAYEGLEVEISCRLKGDECLLTTPDITLLGEEIE